jgi:acyl-CoA thioester hydrolase
MDLLKNYPFIMERSVEWGEMDAAQHVNNIVYLRYFETARIHYFNQINFMDFTGHNLSVGPILAEISCKYKVPLTFPDTISIAARILPNSFDEYSFLMHHVVVSHKLQRIAAEGTAKLVCYDYKNLCKAPIPVPIKEMILKIENP